VRSGRIEHQTAASEPEHGARCVVPQRSLTLRLGLRTVRKQTQQFSMHASGYSPIESSSSLTSWPTWLNPISESCNGTSKLDLCIIIAIVTRALCTVVCIGQGIIIPMNFQRYGRLLQCTHGNAMAKQRSPAGHGRRTLQAMQWRPFSGLCIRSVDSLPRPCKRAVGGLQ
jgi:hypothetical protein